MTWVLIVALAWLTVGVLIGIPLARAIRFAEEDEDALTRWDRSDLPAATTGRRQPGPGPRLLTRRPRAGRPHRPDGEPGRPS